MTFAYATFTSLEAGTRATIPKASVPTSPSTRAPHAHAMAASIKQARPKTRVDLSMTISQSQKQTNEHVAYSTRKKVRSSLVLSEFRIS